MQEVHTRAALLVAQHTYKKFNYHTDILYQCTGRILNQVGKRKILLKNFYQCSFCKQVFAKDHQQLKNHIKKFHKTDEEDFQIKSKGNKNQLPLLNLS